MQAQFHCPSTILPVLETKLKAFGCKVAYADAGRQSGNIESGIGKFEFAHDGNYLSVHTADEGLSIQFVLKHVKGLIEEHTKC